jgi:PAS domain S-box-containing protein
MRITSLIYVAAGTVLGALILSLFSIFQKTLIGADPLQAKGFIVPVLMGGISGAVISYLINMRFRILQNKIAEELRHKNQLEQENAERKLWEETAKHFNLALRAVRNVSRIIVRINNRDLMIKSICDTLIENRSYYNAWITLLDETGGVVSYAEAGLGRDFSPMIELLKRGELTDCARKALEQAGIVTVDNPLSACTDCPLSKSYGGRAAMAMRLEYGGKLYGTLCVSIPKELISDEEERGLVEEIAEDIAFALHNLELERERKRTEEELRLNESRLEALLKLNQMIETSMQKITDFALEEAVRLTKSKIGYLAFMNEDETVLTMHSWSKTAMKQCSITDKPIVHPVETTGLWGETVRQRKPIITNDYSAPNPLKKGYPEGHVEIIRHMNIPVFDGEQIVAVAGVGNKNTEYDKTDVRQLTLLMQGMWRLIQQRRTEEALRESERSFRDLVENSLTGISIIQGDQVIYRNPEQEKLLGSLPILFNPEDFRHIHPEDLEKVKSFYQSLSSGVVQTRSIDFRFYPADKIGSEPDMKWIQCKASLIEYQGKEAILVNIMDITKSKNLEHLLRIQDKMSSLGRVAAGIAHEIRNPLAGINIYLKKLEKTFNEGRKLERMAEIFPQIKLASSKIESVIKRVMDFSKPSKPNFILTDISKSIESGIDLSSVALRKGEIKIEKELAHDLPQCHADPQMITQVVLNLISNAADAMKNFNGAKKIEVVSFTENKRIFVKVSDSGPGIPLNLREQIFDPFFTTKNGGTGIGLSICHRIIADHGGTLDVFNSKLGGAEFVIEIPAET